MDRHFKTYSKSFKNKVRIPNPEENWAVFKNVHEPIIEREVWEQVQQHMQRMPAHMQMWLPPPQCDRRPHRCGPSLRPT